MKSVGHKSGGEELDRHAAERIKFAHTTHGPEAARANHHNVTNMKLMRIAKGLALVLVLGVAGCGLAKNTKVAEAEVDRFHQRWNAGEFQAVYDEAHMEFRKAQPAEAMINTMQAVKKNYGNLKSSTRRSWGFNSNGGVTDVRLSYDSAFDHGAAVEAFLFRMTGDRALLVGYDIMTPETAAKQEAEKKEAGDAKRKAEADKRQAERDARKAEKKK